MPFWSPTIFSSITRLLASAWCKNISITFDSYFLDLFRTAPSDFSPSSLDAYHNSLCSHLVHPNCSMSGHSRDPQDPNREYSESGKIFPYTPNDITSQNGNELWYQNWIPDPASGSYTTESTDLMATNSYALPPNPSTRPEEQPSDMNHHQDSVFTNSQKNIGNNAAKLTPTGFSCYICGRTFKKKHDLHRHIDVHYGVKPNVCNYCTASFARPYDLKVSILSGIPFAQMNRSMHSPTTLINPRRPSANQKYAITQHRPMMGKRFN